MSNEVEKLQNALMEADRRARIAEAQAQVTPEQREAWRRANEEARQQREAEAARLKAAQDAAEQARVDALLEPRKERAWLEFQAEHPTHPRAQWEAFYWPSLRALFADDLRREQLQREQARMRSSGQYNF